MPERPRQEPDPVNVGRYHCTKETEKALLVAELDDPTKKMWIPKSCVMPESEVRREEDLGALIVADWFALKEGLM